MCGNRICYKDICNFILFHGRSSICTPLRFQPITLLYKKGAKSKKMGFLYYKRTIFGDMLDDGDGDGDCD